MPGHRIGAPAQFVPVCDLDYDSITSIIGMRLSDFIIKNLEPILQAWEDFERTIEVPGEALDSTAYAIMPSRCCAS